MLRKIVTGAAARRAAQRALYEGAEPSFANIGAACGLRTETLQSRAKREGWKERPKGGTPEQRQARIALMLDEMVADLEAVKKDRRTGRYDKARIDALSAKMRMLEKLSEINESRQARQEEEQKTDAEIAAMLGRIDARIVALAREFALELVRDRGRAPVGGAPWA